jgi:fatty acid desaturase
MFGAISCIDSDTMPVTSHWHSCSQNLSLRRVVSTMSITRGAVRLHEIFQQTVGQQTTQNEAEQLSSSKAPNKSTLSLTGALQQGAHIPGAATKFCTMPPNILSKIIAVLFLTCQHVYQFTCIEQKGPDNSGAHRSLHMCRSSVWNSLHVTFLAPRI